MGGHRRPGPVRHAGDRALGEFFNQELYGPPTTLRGGSGSTRRIVSGITSTHDATGRVDPLPSALPVRVGVRDRRRPRPPWLARRRRSPLVSGDLLLIFFIWYGLTLTLKGFRTGNWTFFGIPTAQIVTAGFILVGVLGLIYQHRPGRPAETAAELLPDRDGGPAGVDDEEAFWSDDADDGDDDDDDEAEDGRRPTRWTSSTEPGTMTSTGSDHIAPHRRGGRRCAVNASTVEFPRRLGRARALDGALMTLRREARVIDPSSSLGFGAGYTAEGLETEQGVADIAGNRLAADFTWASSTAALNGCPCSIYGSGRCRPAPPSRATRRP